MSGKDHESSDDDDDDGDEDTYLFSSSLDPRFVRQRSKEQFLPTLIVSIILSLQGFVSGYGIGYTSPIQSQIQEPTTGISAPDAIMSKLIFTIFSSFFNLGAAVGALSTVLLSDLIGRKDTLIVSMCTWSFGFLLLSIYPNQWLLIAGRILTGVGLGISTSVTPTYISEVVSAKYRGLLGTLFQLFITIGILFAFVIGIPFAKLSYGYLWMGIVGLFVSLFILCLLVFQHRSPVWLVYKGREKEAMQAFRTFRGAGASIKNDMVNAGKLAKLKLEKYQFSIIFTKPIFKPLMLCTMLMVFQQLSGINAVIFYSTDILSDAIPGIQSQIIPIAPAVVQVVVTFLSSLFVDRFGRKILLTIASIGMCASSVTIGAYFIVIDLVLVNCTSTGPHHDPHPAIPCHVLSGIVVLAVCCFLGFFALAWGPVPWIYASEVVSVKLKNWTIALITLTSWMGSFVVTIGFPYYASAVQQYGAFFTFAGVNVVAIIFILIFIVETKGKPLDKIQNFFIN